jgi:hypothetical protein
VNHLGFLEAPASARAGYEQIDDVSVEVEGDNALVVFQYKGE